jgi:hypothetical protein
MRGIPYKSMIFIKSSVYDVLKTRSRSLLNPYGVPGTSRRVKFLQYARFPTLTVPKPRRTIDYYWMGPTTRDYSIPLGSWTDERTEALAKPQRLGRLQGLNRAQQQVVKGFLISHPRLRSSWRWK